MNICVFGLWHLGTVTAACLAKAGFEVVGLDVEQTTILGLKNGKSPVYEPGLDDLLSKGIQKGKLDFTTDPAIALHHADVLWVTFDTPVNEDDQADVEFVKNNLVSVLRFVEEGTNVIISSQVPVGFTRSLEEYYATAYRHQQVKFAYSPENLRLGKAIQVFENPDRIVIGIRETADKDVFLPVFSKISDRLEWMKTESAEMTKHGLNAFLATSVTFANELATLCESLGADAKEVERGLKSDSRIGPKAYLSPGSAFAGGTLARDIQFLIKLGQHYHRKTYLFKAVRESNDYHKDWTKRKCLAYLKDLNGRKIAILGLTYKAGTDTLRRSLAVELSQWFSANGAQIQAYDPQVKTLPDHLTQIISLKPTVEDALDNAECVVIATEWPVFQEFDEKILDLMSHKIVIDANGFLRNLFKQYPEMTYVVVGKGT